MIPNGISVWQQFFIVTKNGILPKVSISFIFTYFVISLICTITLKALLDTPITSQQPWQVPGWPSQSWRQTAALVKPETSTNAASNALRTFFPNSQGKLYKGFKVRCGSGGPRASGHPLTLGFEAPKLSIFGPYLIFSIIFFALLHSAYYFFNMLLFQRSN